MADSILSEKQNDSGKQGFFSNRLELWLFTAILVAAAVLRFWYLSEVVHAPDYSALQQDPEVQDHFARAILSGDWSERPGETDPELRTTPFYRPPGYGYLLTVIYFFTQGSYLAPRLLNIFLGLATVVLLFRLGKDLFGSTAGLVSAFFAAVYGIFIYWEGEVNDPAIFVFLAVALFYLLLKWSEDFKLRYLVLLGLLFGAYGLARPNILGFGPFVALWLGWIAWRKKRVWVLPAAWIVLLVSTFVLIIPVTIRNYVVSGEFVPIATYFGHNLIIGNHEESDGISPWLPYLQELEGTGKWAAKDYVNVIRGLAKEQGLESLSHTEASNIFAKKARDYMRSHPGATIKAMVKKGILLWTPVEITCNKVVEKELATHGPLPFLPTFRWIAVLFASGTALLLWALVGRRFSGEHSEAMPLVWLMLFFVFFYLVSFLPFFVNGRARVPALPILILLGSYGAQCCANWLQRKEYRPALIYGAALVACLAFFSVEWIVVKPDISRWHYQRADSWLRRGETEKALEEGRLVITAEGKAYMHQRLGREFMALGYPDDAIAQYQAGLERDPEYQDLWFLLGTALEERGDLELAEQTYRDALKLNPYDARALNALGMLCSGQERYEEALEHFDAALAVAPDYGDVIDHISQVMKALGRVDEGISRFRSMLAEDGEQKYVHFFLGRDLLEIGNRDEALRHFSEALRIDPALDGASYLWAQELSRQGRFEEAIEQHRSALTLNSELKYTQAALGRELSRLGHTDEAIHHFSEAVRIDPAFQDARYLLGKELARASRVEEAQAEYEKAIELNPADARAHHEMGMFQAEQGNFEEALNHFESALEVDPTFAYALDRMGRVLAVMGRSEEAIARYKDTLAADPENQDICYLLGRELLAQGNQEEAQQYFLQALQLNPSDARAHNELGALLAAEGKNAEAMRHYEEALRAAPQFGYVLYKMGQLLAAEGDLQAAEARFKEALNLDPDNQDLYYLIGRELVSQERNDEALGYFEKALAMNPSDARAHNDYALIIGSKNPEEAMEHYETALKIAPDFSLALNNWGNLLVELGKLEEGEAKYRQALENREEDEYAWYNLARLAEKKGELKEAESFYLKAMENNPENSQIPNNLGLLLAAQGRNQEARRYYEQALAIDKANPLPYNNLGQLAEKEEAWEDALKAYEQALAEKPAFLLALNNLTALLVRMDRDDETAAYFLQALESEAENGDIHNSYGYYLFRRGELDEGRNHFLKAIECIPVFPLAMNNLGNLEFQAGNLEEAEKWYLQALEVHPLDLRADYYLGRLYQKQGRRDEAIRMYESAAVKQADTPSLLLETGNALARASSLKGAVHCFEQVLNQEPDNQTALFNLASVYVEGFQDKEKALPLLQHLEKLNPDFPGLKALHEKSG